MLRFTVVKRAASMSCKLDLVVLLAVALLVPVTVSVRCGATLRNLYGFISSPNYPLNYPHDSDCAWRFDFATSSIARITFYDFQLEDDVRCAYDALRIYTYNSSQTTTHKLLCGGELPPFSVFSTAGLVIRFTSDYSLSRKGFELRYVIQVNGMWSSWSDWSACDRSCGNGTKYRTRVCDNPAPAHGGQACVGRRYENQNCKTKECTVCGTKMDVLFLLDSSTTVGETNFRKQKQLVKLLAQRFDVAPLKSRAAIITFSTDAIVHAYFGQYETLSSFQWVVDTLPYRPGVGKIDRALTRADQRVFPYARPDVVKIAILVADARERIMSGRRKLREASQLLKNDGVRVLVVGIAPRFKEKLRLITNSRNDVMISSSFDRLLGGVDTLSMQACQVSGPVECGTKVSRAKIVGGTTARPGAWPWLVSINKLGKHHCGGSIIAAHWVVTAAHCFDINNDPTIYSIVAGEHDSSRHERYEQNLTIERVTIHPWYDKYSDHATRFDYDVALVKLAKPFKYNSHVRPVCLPKSDFAAGTRCSISGWGFTREGGTISQILMQAKVPLVSRDTCQRGYSDLGYTITARMRCAGYAEGGTDSCSGDSGGPLTCERNGKWYLMGVVSWGYGCARRRRYGVYTHVMELKRWIEGIVNS